MPDSETGPPPRHVRPSRRLVLAISVVLGVVVLAASVPALRWRGLQLKRVRCQSNLRRLSTALLLYAQDHDFRLPPPDYRTTDGRVRTWVNLLGMYIEGQRILECPANPARDARITGGTARFGCSYALNARFWGHFAPGPYPIENLEMPAATAFLVESGPMRRDGPFGGQVTQSVRHTYWDTGAEPGNYPSPHGRRMNIVAVDGHVQSIEVAHYDTLDHSAEFGRLGGGVFNWNGGHPNGKLADPPLE